MSDMLREVQAVFASDDALQAGIAKLQLAGFDRAEISLPTASPTAAETTPDLGADTPVTTEDSAQMRTMGTSMAGAGAAMAAAGLTIATGGAAAVAIAAAAAIGVGAGGLAHSVGRATEDAQSEKRDDAADRGELVLSVLARDAAHQDAAVAALHAAGALRVQPVTRQDGQILA